MARTQAVHCESVGGPHRARQARCWHPLALVNRPLFGRLGPHPALRRPSPGSDSGPTACWQGGGTVTPSSWQFMPQAIHHQHPMVGVLGSKGSGRAEQSHGLEAAPPGGSHCAASTGVEESEDGNDFFFFFS